VRAWEPCARVPNSTGEMMDAIVEKKDSAVFQRFTVYLVLSAVMCGVFTGLRGGIFTVVGARVNRRIRHMLFQALLKQEIGELIR
jgi:ATP-binding cassette, subfamily B (MDR/TAP), member 9